MPTSASSSLASSSFDAIIVGAGAAGMFCAAQAGQRGVRVLLLDHADAPGKKILISGGGRCNFTNVNTAADRYLSANPHFAKSALARYRAQDFIALVDAHGIDWHEKTLGQLFCDGSAKQIVAMLLAEMDKGGVTLRLSSPVSAIGHSDGRFAVSTPHGDFSASRLVLATGGPSIPKLGATGFAYEVARQFGLKVVEPRPALVPLTLGGDDLLFRELSGVATDVIVQCGKAAFREAALFTHRGLSGPAILQISSYWRHGDMIRVDMLPDLDAAKWLRAEKTAKPRQTLVSVLGQHVPNRLAEALAVKLDAGDRPLSAWTDKALDAAGQRLKAWQFAPNGTEGFAKAEVTIGGVSTAGLSSQSMAAKSLPGLYVIGEALDVTGWLGGYNFQWAWASAFAAAEAIAADVAQRP